MNRRTFFASLLGLAGVKPVVKAAYKPMTFMEYKNKLRLEMFPFTNHAANLHHQEILRLKTIIVNRSIENQQAKIRPFYQDSDKA